MALRKYGGWTTSTSTDGQISVEQSVGSLEVTIHDDGIYEIEFNEPELGLVIETDYYGQHAIVRSVNAHSAAGRLNLIQEGDVLVAVNDTIVLHERFQNIIRYISTLKQQGATRRLRFLNPLQCPVAAYEEKLQLGRKDQKDMYGFHRTLEQLLAERQYLGQNMQKFAQRDLEWYQYLRDIGGLHNLKPDGVFKPSPILKALVRRGIPVAFRPRVWPYLCGANQKRASFPSNYYRTLVARAATELDAKVRDDIEKDVDRTFPEHAMFHSRDGIGALRKLLFAYALHNPEVGYCQSLNFIAGMMLLFMDQEEGFWLISVIVEDLLPPNYYSPSMTGTHIDQHVFACLIADKLPKIDKNLKRGQLHLPLITLQWFLCLFVNTLPTETALRVWDMFFNEGDKVLFKIAIGLLKMHEAKLLSTRDSGEIFTIMRDLGHEVVDADLLIASSYKLKKYQRTRPRNLEQVANMTLDDMEEFTRADNPERTRQAITGSDVDATEMEERTHSRLESSVSASSLHSSSISMSMSMDGTGSTKKKPKKRMFLHRPDYRSISREEIRTLREKCGIEVREKLENVQRMREQWRKDEEAGLHLREARPSPTLSDATTSKPATVLSDEEEEEEDDSEQDIEPSDLGSDGLCAEPETVASGADDTSREGSSL